MHIRWAWLRSPGGTRIGLLGLALLMVALFFGPTDNWMWDPSFYYAQLRSPLIEGDLDFRNETVIGTAELPYTVTGLQGSFWPIGPGLLWMPFFALGHVLALWIHPAWLDGFGPAYIVMVSLGSALYGMLGLFLCYRIGRHFGEPRHALIATALCLMATPLFFYMFRQPIMAHTAGLFAVAGLVLIYLELRQQPELRRDSGLLLGVGLALAFLMRWNGALLAIIPASYLGEHLLKAFKQRSGQMVGAVLIQALILGLSLVLVISPQLALWQRLYGNAFVMPQGAYFFTKTLLPINLPHILLSTNRGLIFWLPLAVFGLAGLPLIPDRIVRWTMISTIVAQIVLFAYRKDWYGGGGFGSRYFVDLLPLITIGVVCLMRRLPERRFWLIGASMLVLGLSLHQLALLFAFEHILEGWFDPYAYREGLSLGVNWQARTWMHLLFHPLDWFGVRPYVAAERQSLATGLLTGAGVPSMAGLALLCTPAILGVTLLLLPRLRRTPPWLLASGLIVYMVGAGIYLLML